MILEHSTTQPDVISWELILRRQGGKLEYPEKIPQSQIEIGFHYNSQHKRQQEIMEKEMVYGSKPATTPKKRLVMTHHSHGLHFLLRPAKEKKHYIN